MVTLWCPCAEGGMRGVWGADEVLLIHQNAGYTVMKSNPAVSLIVASKVPILALRCPDQYAFWAVPVLPLTTDIITVANF